MALGDHGRTLLPVLEKPLTGAPAGPDDDLRVRPALARVHVRSLDLSVRAGRRVGRRLPARDGHGGRDGIAIERDNSQGDLNGFKALEEIHLGPPGTTVGKREAADLLDIADPAGISLPAQPGDVGLGNPFAFPFNTIEDVVILDRRHVVVLDDNNFPFSVGRHVGSGAPDDEELIVLRLARAIGA